MTFGEKFRTEREKLGLTQQEVADSLGINRRMITRYENGISFPRTKDAYKKIADFFKIDVNYLLTEVFDNKRFLDFGISTEDDGHYLNTSLIFQKEGFGGRGVCYDKYEWNL